MDTRLINATKELNKARLQVKAAEETAAHVGSLVALLTRLVERGLLASAGADEIAEWDATKVLAGCLIAFASERLALGENIYRSATKLVAEREMAMSLNHQAGIALCERGIEQDMINLEMKLEEIRLIDIMMNEMPRTILDLT